MGNYLEICSTFLLIFFYLVLVFLRAKIIYHELKEIESRTNYKKQEVWGIYLFPETFL